VTAMYDDDCSDDELGLPMQLILRDEAGNDVDVINVHGPQYGEEGVTLHEGYEGFMHGDFTLPRESGAYQKGSTPGIVRENERILSFTLGTQAATPALLERVETRLWKVLSPFFECYVRIYSHNSDPREIRIRLERKPKDFLRQGPGLRRFGSWECVVVACDPDWQSEELKYSIKRSQMTNVGGGVWQGTLPLVNPADQGCYPEFACNTLTTSTTVTLPDRDTGRTVTLPALTAGREFLVRTDPLVATLLVRDNSQQWAKLDARSFDADPMPGSRVDPYPGVVRILGGTPDTEITVYLPQRWQRCVGGES
jgi:hypothetical protein